MPYVASSLGAGAGIFGDIKLFKTLDERIAKNQIANQAVVTCCNSIKKKKAEEATII